MSEKFARRRGRLAAAKVEAKPEPKAAPIEPKKKRGRPKKVVAS